MATVDSISIFIWVQPQQRKGVMWLVAYCYYIILLLLLTTTTNKKKATSNHQQTKKNEELGATRRGTHDVDKLRDTSVGGGRVRQSHVVCLLFLHSIIIFLSTFHFCLRRSTVPGPGSRKPICRGFVVRKLKNICYGQKYIASPLPSRLSKFEHL